MRTAMTMGRFGTIESIQPCRLFRLPRAMQAEGVRMLLDMGQSMDSVARRLGISAAEIRDLLSEPPFKRGGEVEVAS